MCIELINVRVGADDINSVCYAGASSPRVPHNPMGCALLLHRPDPHVQGDSL
jgi:hypothetical protein